MGKRRNLYLKTIPVEEAREKYFAALEPVLGVKLETVPVTQALDRITSTAVFARYSSPLFNASAMDGIAVTADDTKDASEVNPVILTEGKYQIVDTGDPIHPKWFLSIGLALLSLLMFFGKGSKNKIVKVIE